MSTKTLSPDVERVEALAHTHVMDCYQCGKCSAGCPVADRMDVIPSGLMRMVQIGEVRQAAGTMSVWQCLSCQTCSTRCPKSVHVAEVIDALKQIAFEKKLIHPKLRRVAIFQKTFIDTVRRNGRLNEIELTGFFKLSGFFNDFSIPKLMADGQLAVPMILRNKLHFKPGSPVKDKAVVRRIFEKCFKETKKKTT
ncbi:MAG: 4Fe-4S dicluster domain-containing protein [Planctomycetaceae bacterium]|jgi:heterodisulfide reductase subunit C|nr:4Fe-4S dicluster domain-containing protein [Planctomycetaceae bacterium]